MTTVSLIDKIRSEARSTAERKVASVLVEGYPTRALTTVETLARQASVSAPTVLRFLAKIGFARYAAFQAAVLDDVERQFGSPLGNIGKAPTVGATATDHIYQKSLMLQAEALQKTAAQALTADFDALVGQIINPKASVKLLGGRYSRNLAERLATQLGQVRPKVTFLPLTVGFLYDALVDIGPADLCVIFDYRRYQPELFQFARGAHAAGTRICLFTDTWRSPIAEYADTILTAPDASTSPFGSRVVATAQVEAVVAAVIQATLDDSRKRLARIEDLRKLGAPPASSTKDPSP
ncbi:MAG: MurR/RpiR family transcriptional regulator [Qingshengfaniella sp.]